MKPVGFGFTIVVENRFNALMPFLISATNGAALP
jgi:hypothetical protein